MKRKIWIIVLALISIASMASSTMAYFTGEDRAHNVITTGGVHILPPYQGSKGGTWYKGTANAIYQNMGFIDLYDPDYVVILSGDHIYKMNYAKMVERHKAAGAACTISVMES